MPNYVIPDSCFTEIMLYLFPLYPILLYLIPLLHVIIVSVMPGSLHPSCLHSIELNCALYPLHEVFIADGSFWAIYGTSNFNLRGLAGFLLAAKRINLSARSAPSSSILVDRFIYRRNLIRLTRYANRYRRCSRRDTQ